MTPFVRVQREPFDAVAVGAILSAGRTDVGALVSFTGLVRDHPLFLEHYPAMAERAMQRVADDAAARWPLLGLAAVHRFGELAPGDPIVLVVAASAHRRAAFEAAEFVMDWLKTRAPFWKRGPEGWVAAKADDEAAAGRWA